jgi:hypothetical protein
VHPWGSQSDATPAQPQTRKGHKLAVGNSERSDEDSTALSGLGKGQLQARFRKALAECQWHPAVVKTLNVDQKYALLYAGARAAGPGTQAVVSAGTSLAKHRMVDVLYGLGYQKK